MTLVLALLFVREARDAATCSGCSGSKRASSAPATFVDRRLPPNAIVITSWQSGSVRFYSGRRTLVWDALDPAWLDRAIAFVRDARLRAVPAVRAVGGAALPPAVRRRARIGALDWPPMAEVASQVRIYRPDDRERYLRGVQPPTEYAR